MIIVEDHANTLPSEIAALEEIKLVVAHINMPELTTIAQEYEANCQNLGGTADECNDNTWSDGPISGQLTH